jgi:hypothetical protein
MTGSIRKGSIKSMFPRVISYRLPWNVIVPSAGFDMACERRTGPVPLISRSTLPDVTSVSSFWTVILRLAFYVNGESKTIQSAASAIQPAGPQHGEGGLKTGPVGDAVEPQISVQRGFIGKCPSERVLL